MTINAFSNLAFDKASIRAFDDDGHMHVKQTPISKATVNPYRGAEIPEFQALGLDADKIYHLLRDPEELAKAAATFNGKPLLFTHKPVSSADHDFEGTVGGISNVTYDHPYLKADLSVHPQHAIDAIKSGEQKELSSAYRYRADMTPGSYEGQRYDGVMRDIKGNHVALVKNGRAGSDVVVGDSIHGMKELLMTKSANSRTGAFERALTVVLRPRLAQDAKIDWSPMLKGVTAKNFKDKKAGIVSDIKKQTTGKLAQDADLNAESLVEAIEALAPLLESDPVVPAAGDPDAIDDGNGNLRSILKEMGILDDDIEKVCAKMGGNTTAAEDDAPSNLGSASGANPADPSDNSGDGGGSTRTYAPSSGGSEANSGAADEDDDDKKDKDKKDKPAMDKALNDRLKGMVSKTAMDAQLKQVAETATAAAVQRHNAIREAERFVRPWVGEMSIAMDSAEAVYRTALAALNIPNADKLHPDALRPILEAQPKPGDQRRAATASGIAQDSAAVAGFAQRYPDAARIRVL